MLTYEGSWSRTKPGIPHGGVYTPQPGVVQPRSIYVCTSPADAHPTEIKPTSTTNTNNGFIFTLLITLCVDRSRKHEPATQI